MSRKLRFFSDQISKAGVTAASLPVMQPDFDLEELEVAALLPFRAQTAMVMVLVICCLAFDIACYMFLLIQVRLGEHESELIEMNTNSEKLRHSYNELFEFKLVLLKVFCFHYELL